MKKPGLLEGLLARWRARQANRLIPDKFRQGCVLDIGCGADAHFLAQSGFLKKWGIDRLISSETEGLPAGESELHLMGLDLEKEARLPFDPYFFDAVTLLAAFEHFERDLLLKILKEVHRVLKPGGLFVMTTPSPWTGGILWLMARLNLVDPVLLAEHKAMYTRRQIHAILEETGFPPAGIRSGTFEFFMNLWARAEKGSN